MICKTLFFTWINKTGKVEQLIMRLKKKGSYLSWAMGHFFLTWECLGFMALCPPSQRPDHPVSSDPDHGPGSLLPQGN